MRSIRPQTPGQSHAEHVQKEIKKKGGGGWWMKKSQVVIEPQFVVARKCYAPINKDVACSFFLLLRAALSIAGSGQEIPAWTVVLWDTRSRRRNSWPSGQTSVRAEESAHQPISIMYRGKAVVAYNSHEGSWGRRSFARSCPCWACTRSSCMEKDHRRCGMIRA